MTSKVSRRTSSRASLADSSRGRVTESDDFRCKTGARPETCLQSGPLPFKALLRSGLLSDSMVSKLDLELFSLIHSWQKHQYGHEPQRLPNLNLALFDAVFAVLESAVLCEISTCAVFVFVNLPTMARFQVSENHLGNLNI